MNTFHLSATRFAPLLAVLTISTGCTVSGDDGNTTDDDGSTGTGTTIETVVHQIEGVEVATLAGSDVAGAEDGQPGAFHNPVNVLFTNGELLVADFDNNRCRVVTPGGETSTLTSQPNFARPFGMTIGKDGALIVQTDWNEDGKNGGTDAGVLWTVDVATGAATPMLTNVGKARGLGTLPDGRIVLSDIERNDIRIYDRASGTMTNLAGKPGEPGFKDGVGKDAMFNRPYGLVVTADGSILVADQNNNRIRRVSLDGTVTTVAGHTEPGMVDGTIEESYFNLPRDLAIDSAGNVYVTDLGNHRIRRISFGEDAVESVAGDGFAGFKDGEGSAAQFFGQEGIDVSADGKTLYVADGTSGEPQPYNRVRRIAID